MTDHRLARAPSGFPPPFDREGDDLRAGEEDRRVARAAASPPPHGAAQPPPPDRPREAWTPRTATARAVLREGEAVTAHTDWLGNRTLHRASPLSGGGDRMEETVLDGAPVREREPGRWVEGFEEAEDAG